MFPSLGVWRLLSPSPHGIAAKPDGVTRGPAPHGFCWHNRAQTDYQQAADGNVLILLMQICQY